MSANFPARTRRNIGISTYVQKFSTAGAQNVDKSDFWLAGRVVGMYDDDGKKFLVLQDESGRVDLIVDSQIVQQKDSKSGSVAMEVGDIVETKVCGQEKIMNGKKTITFVVEEFLVLAKNQSEFFVRKEDPNWKKMIVDLNLKDKLERRSKIIQKIREFFLADGFTETDTPTLVKLPGMEPYLDVFKTEFVSIDKKKRDELYLITSPEYAMKKLLVSGFEKIFQITRSYRNKETGGALHNPEFTMIEWYRAYASYLEIMDDVEKLWNFLCDEFVPGDKTEKTGEKSEKKFERIKVKDAFKKYAGVEVGDFEDTNKFVKITEQRGYKVEADQTDDQKFADAFHLIFLNEIEPKLGFDRPTIVYEYPASMAALSKKCENDPRYAERFEVYINGMELANAFTELNDPAEQKARLEAEKLEREKLGKELYGVDQSFISALECGMPPAGGIALGVDRLVMLLTGAKDIEEVLFFPYKDL